MAWLVATFCLLVAGAVVISLILTHWQIQHSQDQWCDTLRLLTSKPVPRPADPAANPSRVNSYQFYVNLLALRHRFGC
jgi:hypothetical protein